MLHDDNSERADRVLEALRIYDRENGRIPAEARQNIRMDLARFEEIAADFMGDLVHLGQRVVTGGDDPNTPPGYDPDGLEHVAARAIDMVAQELDESEPGDWPVLAGQIYYDTDPPQADDAPFLWVVAHDGGVSDRFDSLADAVAAYPAAVVDTTDAPPDAR